MSDSESPMSCTFGWNAPLVLGAQSFKERFRLISESYRPPVPSVSLPLPPDGGFCSLWRLLPLTFLYRYLLAISVTS